MTDSPRTGFGPMRAGMRRIIRIAWTCYAFAAIAVFLSANAVAREKVREEQIFGWIEHALVSREQVEMKAKLDTGATTSSLHALNIHRFKRNGKRMVRFDIEDPERGVVVTLERPLSRKVRIKESDTGEYSNRPVVELWVCIGNVGKRIEVNLVDRSHFNYPFLVGRNFLAGEILVDADDTFTQTPSCELPDDAP